MPPNPKIREAGAKAQPGILNKAQPLLEEVDPVPDKWRFWAEKAATILGGLDILTVDAVHMADGTDKILEINDTASGFYGPNRKADQLACAELVLAKLEGEESRAALTSSRKKAQLQSMQGLKL